jgi:phosphoserine phosphatase RsbU/P
VLTWVKDQARLRDLSVIMISALNGEHGVGARGRRRFTPVSGEVEFCNAGHNAPYRLGKAVETVEGAKGIIRGVRPDAVYASGQLCLAPGGGIYVFTDGVTEANNFAEEMFGETRLESVLRAAGGSRSAEIVKSVAATVRGFVGNAVPFDDITMLAIHRLDPVSL